MSYRTESDSKLIICEALRARGWKVYGYSEDKSDIYTDYFEPASWKGIAEKNGYILCVGIKDYDVQWYSGKAMYEDIKSNSRYSPRRINALRAIAERGESRGGEASEKRTAERKLKLLMSNQGQYNQVTKILREKYPEFQQNPSNNNWHIEKDGEIIEKGSRAFTYHTIPANALDYCTLDIRDDYISNLPQWRQVEFEKNLNVLNKNIQQFKKFISKIEAIASIRIGDDPDEHVEKLIITRFRIELAPFEMEYKDLHAELEVGCCFTLNDGYISDDCDCHAVYQITEIVGDRLTINRMNNKLTKVINRSPRSNRFYTTAKEFEKWVISRKAVLVTIEQVMMPYTVEKRVRKSIQSTDNNHSLIEEDITDINMIDRASVKQSTGNFSQVSLFSA